MNRLTVWWRWKRTEPCERCGSRDSAQILYGLYAGPPPVWARDRFSCGGCCVSVDSPTHECHRCGHQWTAGVRTWRGTREPGVLDDG